MALARDPEKALDTNPMKFIFLGCRYVNAKDGIGLCCNRFVVDDGTPFFKQFKFSELEWPDFNQVEDL